MGRYDGEDYDTSSPCLPGQHNWALNGSCWHPGCGATRASATTAAIKQLEAEGYGVVPPLSDQERLEVARRGLQAMRAANETACYPDGYLAEELNRRTSAGLDACRLVLKE